MKDIRIKDLYAGKPDAKDEISFDGLDDFVKTFVVADHFNIDSLLNGTNCFITGFKGTGKTALLFYLDAKLKETDPSAWSSFVFFKEDFADVKRDELQALAQRIVSSVTLDSETLLESSEFEYIWRWVFFKRIVADNEVCNRNLFEDNEEWHEFEKTVGQIVDPKNSKKIRIPKSIKLAVPYKDPTSFAEFSPEIEIDLNDTASKSYSKFVELIDMAEEQFARLTKTEIPYFIFVDELEAYYGERKPFIRDLCLIRDLIFTVKRINTLCQNADHAQMKVVCSVRSEILNAISRFVVTKEINKVTAGFSVPLNWNYTNDNSYAHPIMQILLKRIAVCSEFNDENFLKLYQQWFPEKIHNIEPASYILNQSWCKPRDIVRLITAAQNSLRREDKSFSQIVFNTLAKAYSEESLVEIKEELRALYDPNQIDSIISCFTGYKTAFSAKELRGRIDKYFKGTVLDERFTEVLNDLYRLGFLGNVLPASKAYHWQHKGDSRLILSDEWRMCIHYALHGALSLGGKSDYELNRNVPPQIGDIATAEISKIYPSAALVKFKHHGAIFSGRIRITEFRKITHCFIPDLSRVVAVGDKYAVVLRKYNDTYNSWDLEIVADTGSEKA